MHLGATATVIAWQCSCEHMLYNVALIDYSLFVYCFDTATVVVHLSLQICFIDAQSR